jgi:hypothetical protein
MNFRSKRALTNEEAWVCQIMRPIAVVCIDRYRRDIISMLQDPESLESLIKYLVVKACTTLPQNEGVQAPSAIVDVPPRFKAVDGTR